MPTSIARSPPCPGPPIALEGDEALLGLLAEMATSLGGIPVRLAPDSKAAYHAAAVLAAGGLTALLDVVAAVARPTGLDEAGALAVYGPLAAQALANARAMGTAAALTGPARPRRRRHRGGPPGGGRRGG